MSTSDRNDQWDWSQISVKLIHIRSIDFDGKTYSAVVSVLLIYVGLYTLIPQSLYPLEYNNYMQQFYAFRI